MLKKKIYDLLKNNSDLNYFEITNNNSSLLCVYTPSLINMELLQNNVIPKLEQKLFNENINLNYPKIKYIEYNDILDFVYEGYLIVFEKNKILAIDISKLPSRNPETSPHELTLVGAKDGFTENINTNIALLRNRIKNENLKIKYFDIGNLNSSKVALLYMDNICENNIIEDITSKLNSIDTEAIYNIGQFQNLLYESKNLFPKINYTSRCDFAYESLFSGRFIIFINHIPLALIAPINMSFFTNFSDTNNEHFLVGIFDRILQFIAIFLGVFLSGFSVALLSYNLEFLPYLSLANFISARKGISFSIITEMIIADILFQLFRVAGTRSLSGLNQALLIMGSIIISQIAVSSGILTQHVIIISAISIISPYLVSNSLSFNNSLNLLRIIIFIFSCMFGFLGFTISSLCVLLYLLSIDSHGLSFMSPISPYLLKSVKTFLFPKSFVKKDNTIKKGVKK